MAPLRSPIEAACRHNPEPRAAAASHSRGWGQRETGARDPVDGGCDAGRAANPRFGITRTRSAFRATGSVEFQEGDPGRVALPVPASSGTAGPTAVTLARPPGRRTATVSPSMASRRRVRVAVTIRWSPVGMATGGSQAARPSSLAGDGLPCDGPAGLLKTSLPNGGGLPARRVRYGCSSSIADDSKLARSSNCESLSAPRLFGCHLTGRAGATKTPVPIGLSRPWEVF
jgi:hypothetical protein